VSSHILSWRLRRDHSRDVTAARIPYTTPIGLQHREYAAAHRRHHTTVGQTTPLQLSYRDLPEDFDPTVTPFKVTGTDTERSAALLVIHGNHGHTLYSFRDKRRSLSKFAVFSNPRVFNPRPPLREFPLEYCNVGSAQKHQSLMPLPGRWKEFDDM